MVGIFGVDAFFALSGFFITALLLGEVDESVTVKLRRLNTRRSELAAADRLSTRHWPA